jgi:omega-hydroxy-beta-dihydromenaquinone-9 sulfotransferase
MTAAPADNPPARPAAAKKPEWAPRMWQGADFFAWLRLLVRNRFAVHWSCLYIAIIVTFVSFGHTILRLVQEAVYAKRIRRTVIGQPPIFIIGHWRTGTTLLHELMILDERHDFPNTYECMDPNHFLLTERFFTRWLRFLMPSRRPMDNMAAGFERPQEDEFALCMLGAPSPYLTIAFPNHPPQCQEYLDFEGVRPRALARWKLVFYRFLQQLTYKNPKRLVLKSPPHTGRIPVLREMFPGALFIHIVRDPYVVFPSTVNLWKTLYRTHGLQRPTFTGLEEHVFATFLRLHAKLDEGRRLLEPGQFYEVRYEELIRDPVGQMRALYEHFHLGGFDAYLPHLEHYLASVKGYETNRYELAPDKRAEITRRWGEVIRRQGYADGPAEATVAGSTRM